ncbi:hypothetical protein AAFF_G00152190 [Aldrovandia affinis]|uniref:DNA helicase n=1 Tax=Aldrovandia affinis TaxID=143900 RepID=A0AAD7RNY1_9TELE|nr:hypothetical protein AAFF_G00152190 [Aldrovandia affinis]
MTDPGMLSLFGEDGALFSDGIGGLGECAYPDGQQIPMDQSFSSLHQNLPELGQFDFGQYEQPGGALLGTVPPSHPQYHPSPPALPMSQTHAGYPNLQGERRGQPFMGGNTMWGPGATPTQAPALSGPQGPPRAIGAYAGVVGGEFALQNHPRTGPFPQEASRAPASNHFLGHMGPQQGPGLAAPPMRHPAQQLSPHPLHHSAAGHVPPEAATQGRCFSPTPNPSNPQPLQPHSLHQHQQNMGFSSHGQPLPHNAANGSLRFPSYPSSPSQGPAGSTGAGPNLGLAGGSAPMMRAQGYANASGFLPQGGPQGPVPHHHQQMGPRPLRPAQNHQQHKVLPPKMSYSSAPPMSPINAGNPAGVRSSLPPQQAGVVVGAGVQVGGYPSARLQSPGPVSTSQAQQPLPPQSYGGLPLAAPLHPPPSGGQNGGHADSHARQPEQWPQSQNALQQGELLSSLQKATPPPHCQPWPQPRPMLPATQKVPVTEPSPSHPSPEAPAPDLRPATGTSAWPLISDPGEGDHKPKKKKKKKKKEKTEAEEVEGRGPDAVEGPGEEPASGLKKKKTKAKEPKTPKPPKTPKTPKTPKQQKKVKPTMPTASNFKKPSAKKANTETDAEVKRKSDDSDHSDVEEKIPPASPEDEEDDTGTQKRRSNRQVKRKRYTEELEFRISDEEGERREGSRRMSQSEQQAAEVDGPVVEKIMAVRLGKKETVSGEEVEVEEFYVKFKNLSYLHCRWADVEELEKDKRIHQKLKRFKAKQQFNGFLREMDDEPFNPDYVEVDRILDVSESTDENGEPVSHYLVKWCSLPYEDSTWELKADVDQGKIQEFQHLALREPDLERMERPPADDWQKSRSSREYKNDNELREYQLEGVNWLLFNWYNTRNCILADEMGLGKTIQSITFLYEIFMKGIRGPFLVIAPLSTIPNWEREFRTWTDLNVVVYHGSQASRRTIQAYEMSFRDPQGAVIKGAYKFDAVITTFEMILTDCPELRAVGWRCVVIDEAHRLKNRNCKLLEGLKMMDMEHKVLLTGTPLQNTVEELFSLLNFLEPERFPSEATFMQEFGDLKTEEQVQKLQAILKPMMLRRLKEDVEKNLAPKEETIIEVELTNVQKKYYRAILEKNFAFLSKSGGTGGGGGNGNVPNLLNTMMELRKCCNHPYLINGAEEKILDEFREAHPTTGPELPLQAMVQAAGKLVLIDKLLPKLKAGGHRVLIFSQMVRCLDILEDYLIQRRYSYERIDGRVRGNMRQAAIDRFSKPDSDRFVFLLCTRAGGLGINLTAADTCVIFDSDWNPQNDLQAQARCHRIGQSKSVKIYRLITRNSYEREMFDKASLKLGLDRAVLQSMSGRENIANGVQQLSKKEVEDLLRKGAYGALMEAEDEGSKFCEEDIDQILQRRTQTITIECEGKGSTFAKASFVSSGNRTDISLEDPDFWQKWAKKAELDMSAINRRNTLVIDTPRVRKQTRHFSAAKEDELLELSDLESDSEDTPTPTPRPRRPQDRTQGHPRSTCFRVEKNLLVYGWGRWGDILSHGRFKRPLSLRDVETICRALLVYCVNHYRGDENIKSLIWDLITPTQDGQTRDLLNHSGLSAPVARGRKGKKGRAQGAQPILQQADWLASCNPETLLQEDSYKKHLKHQCNKVLLRVRMLYYLRQEVIGVQADKILEGADASEIDVWIPQPFLAEVPCDWWDMEADKSLLIGVFKHGYEKYSSMRADPALCFLEKVGAPDPKAVAAEQGGADLATDGAEGGDLDREDEDPEYKPARAAYKEEMEDFPNSPLDEQEAVDGHPLGLKSEDGHVGKLHWPMTSALTGRLRRLIAACQRSHKRAQQRQEALLMIQAQTRRPEREEAWAAAAKREPVVPERRHRWTRREEADFYRVVSTFGVLYDGQRFDWRHFRTFARLDRRTNENLESYFLSFVAMCRRVCRLPPRMEEEALDPSLWVEPITEERASRTMYRIELLRRIREQVLPHSGLEERLRLCQASSDLPEWWECGRHDHHLLLGASKHGLSRTDYHILNDPQLGFLEAHRKFTQGRSGPRAQPPTSTLKEELGAQGPAPEKMEDSHTQEEVKRETGSPREEGPRKKKSKEKEWSGETKSEGEAAECTAEGEEAEPKAEDEEAEPQAEDQEAEAKAEKEAAEPEAKPTLLSQKGSEEDDEDKTEEEYKSESSHPEVSAASRDNAFDEESNASLSTVLDETRDGSQSGDAPVLYDRSFSFCHWPKDRVVIDRLDVVCETVMKGRWPANRRQLYDFPSALLPGYASTAAGNPVAHSIAELSVVSRASHSGSGSHSEEMTLSPQDSKEEALDVGFPPQRRRRRKVEVEMERVAKRRHLMEMVAQLRESHGHVSAASTSHPAPSNALKGQVGLLQTESPSGTPPNGAFLEDELQTKRRRGRRRNVEGLDLLFSRRNKEDSEMTKSFLDAVRMTPQPLRNVPSPARRDPKTQVTMGNLEHGNRLLGGGTPGNKNLAEWLGRHSAYAVSTASYSPKEELSPFHTPKQKRHRCRNPNKIDVNALTGEERVPVVNRRSGRKLGGALAPPMKDLARWLRENPEFAVSPDWTDIVKQSGFLPDSMFGGLLSGPVVREEGSSRRGRRPKSEVARVPPPVAPPPGLNPLLMGGLMGGLQSLQLAGLLGLPQGDPEQAAALLQLMLPSMLGLGLASAHPAATATPKKDEEEAEGGEGAKTAKAEAGAAAAGLAGMSVNPLAFNPFLLSAMAPGLFYPSMFLPPGLGGLSLPGLPQAVLAGLQRAMAGAGAESSAGSSTANATVSETGSATESGVDGSTESSTDKATSLSADNNTGAGTDDHTGSGTENGTDSGAENDTENTVVTSAQDSTGTCTGASGKGEDPSESPQAERENRVED